MQECDVFFLPCLPDGIVCFLLGFVELRQGFLSVSCWGQRQLGLVFLAAVSLRAACGCFLQDAWEGCLIDIAEGGEVIAGYPLPEAELALGDDGLGIEHLDDGFDLHAFWLLGVQPKDYASVGLGLA